ncbi:hypothetical protein CHLRE_07g315600v5 [Chlamydomonas reinhardtii]|uniref:Uncharacterized protein n=1 Tax=Chlamydomonas reinhardtii TaxID=3055 RepID=A0A2K3DIN8_CHLRE|nr:uncharacterized protein CHLRE_07g315600v5 [Chlamydomonas reinhardtii]PNW80392.1 hypothetical protein CHLRE_07g315600v5 [Chlamydomonas reinhardtii]
MADAGGSSRARRGKRAREGTPAQVTNARVFDALPNEVSARVAAFLPPNEVATTLRLVSPAAAALYFPHRQVKLSQSVPVHAFAAKWTPEAARALTTAQRRSLVQLTANTGVLKNLEVALRVTGVGRTVALEAAAASGRVSVVRSVCGWLKRVAKHPVERPEVEMLVEVAAAAGAVELLRWLKLGQRGAELAYSVALEKACLGGHQGAAELLLRELQGRHPQDWCDLDDIMGLPCLAASKGHYALAQWLLAQIPPHFEPELLDLLATTAAGCSLAQLQAIIAREMRLRGRPTAGIETAAAAAAGVAGAGAAGAGVAGAGAAGGGRGGERQRPQHPDGPWWGEQGGILGDVWEGRFVLAAAAASETPDWREKVEWLLSRGAALGELGPGGPPCTLLDAHGWDPLLDCGLVRGGPERLAWLRDRGSSFDEELGDAAASQGRVEEADFLMDMFGTRCVTFTGVEMACERGHMRMLQALQARGYRFDVLSALEAAARGGQLEVLQWLMQLPPPAPAAAADAAQAAAEAGGAAEAVVAVGAEAEAAEAGAAPALAAAGAAAAGDGAEAAAPAAAGGGAPTRASGRGRSAAPPHPGAKYVTVDLINAAMEGGNLQLLQFVLDLSPRQRLGAATLEVALHHTAGVDGPTATGGSASLPLFDLLVRRGLPLGTNGSPYVTASTGVEGRPLIAALARTYNCPWGPPGRVLSFAIQAGASLSLVKFMLAEGCPVEEEDWVTIAARAQVGWRVQDEVREWVVAQARVVEKRLQKEYEAKARVHAAKERERKKKRQEKLREEKRLQREKDKAKAALEKAKREQKEKVMKEKEKAKKEKERARKKEREKAKKEKEKAKKEAAKAKKKEKEKAKQEAAKAKKAAGPVKKGAVKQQPVQAAPKAQAPKRALPSEAEATAAKGKKGGGGKGAGGKAGGGGEATAAAGSGSKRKR